MTGADRPKEVTPEQLEKRLADARFSHFKPVPVATEVSEDLEIFLTEHADDFPAVAAERITIRSYEYGQLLAHVLGYVGAINEDELDATTRTTTSPTRRTTRSARSGIERTMEAELRGTPGEVRYEVDARNVPVRRLDGGREADPGQRRLPLDRHQPPVPRREVARRAAQGRQRPTTSATPMAARTAGPRAAS